MSVNVNKSVVLKELDTSVNVNKSVVLKELDMSVNINTPVVLKELDMSVNVNKSVVLRCGDRFKVKCANLLIDGNIIKVCEKFKYLGIVFKSGKSVSCCVDHTKLSFYKAFNALYSKSKTANSEMISVQLLKSFCLPIITYAIEAQALNNCALKALDNLIDNAVRKIFEVSSNDTVEYCRYVCNLPSIKLLSQLRVCRFLLHLEKKQLFTDGILLNLMCSDVMPAMLQYGLVNTDCKHAQLTKAVGVIAALL